MLLLPRGKIGGEGEQTRVTRAHYNYYKFPITTWLGIVQTEKGHPTSTFSNNLYKKTEKVNAALCTIGK